MKAEGSKAFTAKDYAAAAKVYSRAIEIDANNHVLYSNRAACASTHHDELVAGHGVWAYLSLKTQNSFVDRQAMRAWENT